MTSSSVKPWFDTGAGREGKGCVGHASSPGTSLAGTAPVAGLPMSLGNLAVGQSVTITLEFASEAFAGNSAPFSLTGTYTGGSFTVTKNLKL